MVTQSAVSTPAAVVSVPAVDSVPAEVHEAAARLGVSQYLPQVIDLTREIYGGFAAYGFRWIRNSPTIRTLCLMLQLLVLSKRRSARTGSGGSVL